VSPHLVRTGASGPPRKLAKGCPLSLSASLPLCRSPPRPARGLERGRRGGACLRGEGCVCASSPPLSQFTLFPHPPTNPSTQALEEEVRGGVCGARGGVVRAWAWTRLIGRRRRSLSLSLPPSLRECVCVCVCVCVCWPLSSLSLSPLSLSSLSLLSLSSLSPLSLCSLSLSVGSRLTGSSRACAT